MPLVRGRRGPVHTAVAVTAGLAVASLAACVPGTSGQTSSPTPQVSSDFEVDPVDEITLTMLDWFTEGPQAEWIDAVIEDFRTEYPNVTVERTSEGFGDLLTTLNLRASGDKVPDLLSVNQGWQGLGTLADAGLVMNLDQAAERFGWDERIPGSIRKQHMFDVDAQQLGVGSLYGVPTALSALVGVYYNADKLAALELEVPTTFEEFEASLEAARAAGEVPIAFGTLEQTSATLPVFAILNAIGDQDEIQDFVYGVGDGVPSSIGLEEAAAIAQGWAEAGYFTPEFNGIAFSDSAERFVAGEGLYSINYTGVPQTQNSETAFGYFTLPHRSGSGTFATGSATANFSVATHSEHPEAAAALLDYLSSDGAAQRAADLGLLPLGKASSTSDDLLFTDLLAAQQHLDSNDAYVPYLDWATTTFLDVLGQQAQEVLIGSTTPADMAEAADADYAAHLARQGQ